jgi:hypothetical protein
MKTTTKATKRINKHANLCYVIGHITSYMMKYCRKGCNSTITLDDIARRINDKLYCIVLYCIVLYCIVLYCIVLYCIVLYCIVLYCIILYCILLHKRYALHASIQTIKHQASSIKHQASSMTWHELNWKEEWNGGHEIHSITLNHTECTLNVHWISHLVTIQEHIVVTIQEHIVVTIQKHIAEEPDTTIETDDCRIIQICIFPSGKSWLRSCENSTWSTEPQWMHL